MGSPSSIKEVRYNIGTTANVAFGNGAESLWNVLDGTAQKLRVIAYDDSGLTQEGLPDETLQTRMHATPKTIAGLREGTVKMTTYAGAAFSNLAVAPEIGMVQAAMGGIQSATNARSTTASGTGTTVNVLVANADTYAVAGQAVKIGAKADGRGGAEVKPINSVTSNSFGLAIACAAAPISGDAVIVSDTAFFDEDAAEKFIDTYALGHAAADHRQTIGGVATYSLTGMAPGELPKLEIELQVTDHQWITAAGDRSSLAASVTPQGSQPPYDKGIGLVHVGDKGDSARTARKCGNLVFNPGSTFEMLPAPHGVNGKCGFEHMPGTPTAECTLLMDEDAGLIADFPDTAKVVLFQLGHETGGTVAVEFPNAFLDALPVPEDLNNLKGLKITIHGDEDFVSGNDLMSSPVRVHWF